MLLEPQWLSTSSQYPTSFTLLPLVMLLMSIRYLENEKLLDQNEGNEAWLLKT